MTGFTITEESVTAITELQQFRIELLLINQHFEREMKEGDILLVKRPSRLHALEVGIDTVERPPSPLPYLRFTLVKGRVYPDGVFPIPLEDGVEN